MLIKKTQANVRLDDCEKHSTQAGTALFAIVLIGATLRLHHLRYQSLWYDEAHQYLASLKPLYLITDLSHLLLSHYIQHFVVYYGQGKATLRMQPAIFVIATFLGFFTASL